MERPVWAVADSAMRDVAKETKTKDGCMAERGGSSAAAERLSPGCKARIVPRRAHLVDGVPCASLSVTPSFATDHGAHNPATPAARPCSKSVRIEGPFSLSGS